MKNDFNRYGLVKTYDGINVAGISGARKTGLGTLLLPDQIYKQSAYGVSHMNKHALNCWKTLKTIEPQRNDEIYISVMVVKTEKINCMRTRLNPLFFF